MVYRNNQEQSCKNLPQHTVIGCPWNYRVDQPKDGVVLTLTYPLTNQKPEAVEELKAKLKATGAQVSSIANTLWNVKMNTRHYTISLFSKLTSTRHVCLYCSVVQICFSCPREGTEPQWS